MALRSNPISVECLLRRSTTSAASSYFSQRVSELSSSRQAAQLGSLDLRACQFVGRTASISKSISGARVLEIRCLDAAMPFDSEFKLGRQIASKDRLKIGIVGFGNFGQFLARRFARHGHELTAWSRTDYTKEAKQMGVRYFSDLDDFCEDHPDVVLLCTSILSTAQMLRRIPLQRLKRSTLFVDMLSVKVFPKTLLLQTLPPEFDILCTHPMFGPESGKSSWQDLPFVFDRVRIRAGRRTHVADCFLQIFEREGCRMVPMSCEQHDEYAAGTQFVTHTVGRVLGKLGLESTPINTKGYETLLTLVENTAGDSFDLYYGLFMYNTNATEQLQRLESAFDAVRKQLLDQLHEVLRQQLFGSSPDLVQGGSSTTAIPPAPADVAAGSAMHRTASRTATAGLANTQIKPNGSSDVRLQGARSDPSSPLASTVAGYDLPGFAVPAPPALTPSAALSTPVAGGVTASEAAARRSAPGNQGGDEQWVATTGDDVELIDEGTESGSASIVQASQSAQGRDGIANRPTAPNERSRFIDQQ